MNEPPSDRPPSFWAIRDLIVRKFRERVDYSKARASDDALLRKELRFVVERICDLEAPTLSRAERRLIVDQALKDLFP